MKYLVYVISLAKDTQKRQNLKNKFKDYDEFEIIDAIDGKNLNAKQYFDLIIPYFNRTKKIISPSEVGCALSHIKACEKFLQMGGAEHCLILEDDCLGNDECIKKAFEIAQNLPQNSFFHLGGFEQSKPPKIWGKIYNHTLNLSPLCIKNLTGAVSYIIDKKSALNILNAQKSILSLSDDYENVLKSVENVYFKNLFGVDLANSNIQDERSLKIKSKKPLLKKLSPILFVDKYLKGNVFAKDLS